MRGGDGGIFDVTAGAIAINGSIDLSGGTPAFGTATPGATGTLTLRSTVADIAIRGPVVAAVPLIDAARDLIVASPGGQILLGVASDPPLGGTLRTGRDLVATDVDGGTVLRFDQMSVGRDFTSTVLGASEESSVATVANRLTVGGNLLFTAGAAGADPAALSLRVGTLDVGGRITDDGNLSYATRVTAGGDITVGNLSANQTPAGSLPVASSTLTTPGALTVPGSLNVYASPGTRSTATLNAASVTLATNGYNLPPTATFAAT